MTDDLSAETIDRLRDLCEAVAILAHGTVHMIGTNAASDVIGKAMALSTHLDELEDD